METLIDVLTVLKDFSPLGIAALALVGLILMIWKNPFRPIENSLNEIKGNHLHQLPEMASNMEKTVEILQRVEVKLGENFAHIKARLDD